MFFYIHRNYNFDEEVVYFHNIVLHDLFDLLDYNYNYNFDLYLEWQVLFLEINESRKPLDDYFYGRIAELNKKTKEFIKFLSDEKSNNRSITL